MRNFEAVKIKSIVVTSKNDFEMAVMMSETVLYTMNTDIVWTYLLDLINSPTFPMFVDCVKFVDSHAKEVSESKAFLDSNLAQMSNLSED